MIRIRKRRVRFVAIFLVVVASTGCSGSYGGMAGSDVIARNDAHNRLLEARLLRYMLCGQREEDELAYITLAMARPRQVLDGAYYEVQDVEYCYTSVLLTACGQLPQDCGMKPKEWYSGKLFQGGF